MHSSKYEYRLGEKSEVKNIQKEKQGKFLTKFNQKNYIFINYKINTQNYHNINEITIT